MKSFFRSAAALTLASVMGAALLTGCGSSKIDGSQTVVTVNDEKVDLGVVSFYAKYTQAQVYQYYGQMMGSANNMFDTSMADSSDATIGTYGESLRKSALTDVEKLAVISQHAKDYNVSLTDDDEKKIDEVAKDYISKNTESVRDKIGASEADVKKLLEYQTIQAKMLDPLAKDVDTNVTQKEAQQSKVTYVAIDPDSISGNSASSNSAQKASSSAESTAEKNQSQQKAEQEAQQILSALEAESDPANADMDAIAKKVDNSLTASVGHYSTNDTTNGSVDSEVVKAVKGMADGTVVDHVVTGSNKKTLYVVRFDLTDDADYTETQKQTIIRQRKQSNYDKIVNGWVKKSKIKVDSKVLNTLKITDEDPITLKAAASSASTVSGDASASANSATASANSASADSASTNLTAGSTTSTEAAASSAG